MFESKEILGVIITALHNEVARESKSWGDYCHAQREVRAIIARSALGEQDKEDLESHITRLEADATIISYILGIQHGVSMMQLFGGANPMDKFKRLLEQGGPLNGV